MRSSTRLRSKLVVGGCSVGAAMLVVGLVGEGCRQDAATCYRGDHQGCPCPNNGWGYAACNPELDGFGACVCNGSTPGIDAGVAPPPQDAAAAEVDAAILIEAATVIPCTPDGGADAGDAGIKKYFEACTTNEECETCLCETFVGVRKCTTSCSSLDQCPAPAEACTNRGVCRPPP